MRACPAVAVQVRAGTGWRLVQTGLHAAAAAALSAWAAQHLELGTARQAIVVGAAALIAAAAGWHMSGVKPMQLAWSGSAWQVGRSGDFTALTAPPMVAIDIGGWMLLRLRSAAGVAWWPVSRAAAGAQWHLWRAAVYSSAPGPEHRSPEERTPS